MVGVYQTTSRPADIGGNLYRAPRHGSHLSISDENHHVTEAIGNMYGDIGYPRRESAPMNGYSAPENVAHASNAKPVFGQAQVATARPQLSRPLSGGGIPPILPPHSMDNSNGTRRRSGSSGNGLDSERPQSPGCSFSERPPLDAAHVPFPLNDVSYESNPAAVAQEMVNLQALRRMSMVDNATNDPDLPSYSAPHIPTVAPTGADDEDDTSRLFWVPASLHPELAPKEFKTFLEKRIGEIKRTAGDGTLSPNGSQRQGAGGGLRRKKSMLSRQIDNLGGRGAEGYEDGAERLERKRSRSGQPKSSLRVTDLQELDVLAQDPSRLVRKVSLETELMASENAGEVPASEDMPILPAAPPGHALRRSTRTTYRRGGSQRKVQRTPFAKRAVKVAETDSEDSSSSPAAAQGDDAPLPGISRVQTEPIPKSGDHIANFSLPSLIDRTSSPGSVPAKPTEDRSARRVGADPSPRPRRGSASFAQRVAVEGISSNRRPSSPSSSDTTPIPKIVETPPSVEGSIHNVEQGFPHQNHIPERRSSHEPPPPLAGHGPSTLGTVNIPKSSMGSGLVRHAQNARPAGQTLNDIVSQPSPLPGNSTRTDSLSFIPTYTEERKTDKKGRDKKERDGPESGSARKSSWNWLLGGEEKEKEKEKEANKKAKSKTTKAPERPHDNARLDLLQTSIDGSRGRESLVLDRESIKLEEERKKESSRKSAEPKKEKESGLFSTFFGGGKKKGDRDAFGKGGRGSRGLSPDPPHRVLRPDIDYHWTRFPLVEERAIYRMAHIKLANPRRPLYCQVLLSNFMYSYLAKVQQMHPNAQVPQTLLQKQQQQGQQQTQSEMQSGTMQSNPFYSSSNQVRRTSVPPQAD